jgi:hypothetical protein
MDIGHGVTNAVLIHYLAKYGWKKTPDEGRLMLLELVAKAGAGCYNSHSEELFVNSFGLLKKDRSPSKIGMKFIMSMVYNDSNKRPRCFSLMELYRTETIKSTIPTKTHTL